MDYKKLTRGARLRNGARRTVQYTLLTIWALLVLFPFYWMLLTSVKSYGSYNAEYIPKLFTLSPTLSNYLEAFRAVPLAKYFLNTVIFTLATTAVMLMVTVTMVGWQMGIMTLNRYLRSEVPSTLAA